MDAITTQEAEEMTKTKLVVTGDDATGRPSMFTVSIYGPRLLRRYAAPAADEAAAIEGGNAWAQEHGHKVTRVVVKAWA
jgi:hypothetical protein